MAQKFPGISSAGVIDPCPQDLALMLTVSYKADIHFCPFTVRKRRPTRQVSNRGTGLPPALRHSSSWGRVGRAISASLPLLEKRVVDFFSGCLEPPKWPAMLG